MGFSPLRHASMGLAFMELKETINKIDNQPAHFNTSQKLLKNDNIFFSIIEWDAPYVMLSFTGISN